MAISDWISRIQAGDVLVGEALAAAPQASAYDPRDEEAKAQADIDKALGVVRRILASSDEQFRSRQFLIDALLEYGFGYNDWPHFARYRSHTNASNFGTLQFPTEFVDFLMEASTYGITSAAEIGVWRGASAYFAAAVLQRANRDCQYTLIDIQDILLGFEQFSEHLNLIRRVPSSAEDLRGQSFDFVFIDADHSYDGAQKDYVNVGRFARKLCAFHDIHALEYTEQGGGVMRFWNELRDDLAREHRMLEYSHVPNRYGAHGGMGIGVVDLRS